MKKILLLLLCLLILLLSGCINESSIDESFNPYEYFVFDSNEIIYNSAINLAKDFQVKSAIEKLNTLSEPYKNSDELIEMFEKALESPIIGTWYCLDPDSYDDSTVLLLITPYYHKDSMYLYFYRDFNDNEFSSLSSGRITGSISMPPDNDFSVSFIEFRYRTSEVESILRKSDYTFKPAKDGDDTPFLWEMTSDMESKDFYYGNGYSKINSQYELYDMFDYY